MPVFIILLGPPGVGKGTQAEILSKRRHLPHISSGDLFREHIKNKTGLGKLAQTFMDRGELVPDEVTIKMIRERLYKKDCQDGALLDGFPRTSIQAQSLDKLLEEFGGKVNVVPFINAPESTLVERLSGRWTCRANGHIYHEKTKPPIKEGVCDLDGSELYQREDDKTETVARRIKVYFSQTAPLIEYYKRQGKLIEVNGDQSIDRISSDLMAVLGK